MSRKASLKKPSKTRTVHYEFVGPFNFDVVARLKKAERDGIVSIWDDGRQDTPWFEGPPGKAIRDLRDEFFQGGGLPFGRPFTHPEQRR